MSCWERWARQRSLGRVCVSLRRFNLGTHGCRRCRRWRRGLHITQGGTVHGKDSRAQEDSQLQAACCKVQGGTEWWHERNVRAGATGVGVGEGWGGAGVGEVEELLLEVPSEKT